MRWRLLRQPWTFLVGLVVGAGVVVVVVTGGLVLDHSLDISLARHRSSNLCMYVWCRCRRVYLQNMPMYPVTGRYPAKWTIHNAEVDFANAIANAKKRQEQEQTERK